jgi:hypothetical protein
MTRARSGPRFRAAPLDDVDHFTPGVGEINRLTEAFGRRGRAVCGVGLGDQTGFAERGIGIALFAPSRFHIPTRARHVLRGRRAPSNEMHHSIAAGRDLRGGNDALVRPAPRRPPSASEPQKRQPIAIRPWEV